MTKEQWYKVTRYDGTVQYATKWNDQYFLWGSGFGIGEFDAYSVEEVDDIPNNYERGFVFFEFETETFKAVIDTNRWWNGWAMPYIHESDVKRLCHMLNENPDMSYTMSEDKTILVECHEFDDIPDTTIIPEQPFDDGETYYYFGGEGLCFDFKTNTNTNENEE